MGLKSTYLFLSACLLLGVQAQAQLSCSYTLELFDSFGDGWNGSVLTVTVNGNDTDYTLLNDENDSFNAFTISLMEGDDVSLSYSPGTFEGEVTYFLYDSDGNLVFSDGPTPQTGTDVFSFEAVCPSCPSVAASTVSIDNIRAFYADVSWVPTDPDGVYQLEFGDPGFTPGDGNIVAASGGSGRIQPLLENTDYEFYLSVLCANGDTSQVIGPFAFTTRWAVDVGIVNVESPETGCGLTTNEELNVTLFNYGGLPQTLIPFNYSVNGVPGGVNQPADGFLTHVLGTDSTFTVPFDMGYDFSAFGEYEVKVWTELADDSVITNDTFTVTVINAPIISQYPYSEDFETWQGGWRVGDASQNSSWAYGMPNGAVIDEAASGSFAWVTNLEGNYNLNEQSFLRSPCFDFTSLEEDPRLFFSLNVSAEAFDEVWVEVSIDGGDTWEKVGTAGTGEFWYNDTFSQWWDGNGGFDGWVRAKNVLEGTNGESDVAIRFVFNSDGFGVQEGIGIDDIVIAPFYPVDLAASSAEQTSAAVCGDGANSIAFTILNDGLETQSGFDVNYQVNGGDVISENVGPDFVLDPGQDDTYTFNTTFSSLEPGDYTVAVWTDIAGDGLGLNDTTTFTFTVAPVVAAFPYYQDFESGNGGWSQAAQSVNGSWSFGEPAGVAITGAASGLNAWVTNLAGNYNNSELSYLLSPCFDFSTLAEDPSLSFSLFFDSEACCDEGWVEVSTDGGDSWTKVGTAGTGVNWYNDTGNNWWDGTGGFSGWVAAKNTLTGTAGEPNVNIRFVLSTDGSVFREGIGIDDVFITEPLAIDLAVSGATHQADEQCGSPTDSISFTVTNAGEAPQSGFTVNYQLEGGDLVTEMVPDDLVLEPGASYVHTFMTTVDASTFFTDYNLTLWAEQPGDGFLINDTTYLSFTIAPTPLPYAEDFEDQVVPADWTADADLFVTNAHNNLSYVLADNMFSGDTEFNATMPVVGPVEATDTLYFDYRYTDWSAGTEPALLSGNDLFTVLISTDCGETYEAAYVINVGNHVPSVDMATVSVPLSDYAGEYIKIQFSAIWGVGDYWLDLDNIFIPRCPASLDLATEVTPATGASVSNGQAQVSPGNGEAPYSYSWSNGQTGAALINVLPGDYSVTVTDRFGCSDVATVTVDFTSAAEDLGEHFGRVRLAPNPTGAVANLDVTFNQPVDAQVRVFNMLGQEVWRSNAFPRVTQLDADIDLQGQSAGIYLVRIQADEQVKVVKLVKQ